jgi:hypothetical protein
MLAIAAILATASGCGGTFSKQYEYEEDVYLDLDGSATIMVNASIPALVALRGFELATGPRARVDRELIRSLYASPIATVTRVSRPWRRNGRRFVQIRLSAGDFRRVSTSPPFSWSATSLEHRGDTIVFEQTVAASANKPVSDAGWDGSELVAFRLHLPARIQEHNTPSRRVERGNILIWEQPLRDRLAGVPVHMIVRMDNQSILYRTLWIFASAFAAAMALLAALIWWVIARGRKDEAESRIPNPEFPVPNP